MPESSNSFLTDASLQILSLDIEKELRRILNYWEQYSMDKKNGGFLGRIDEENRPYPLDPKGAVLNARILWSFSAAFQYTKSPVHQDMAARAFHYIRDFFTDPVYGGLYWSVDYQGNMLDGHKQIYAQAFGIYGMSEYYRVTKDKRALELAISWYQLIEKYSRDVSQGGYREAFSRDWSFLNDQRLSDKDENAPKTMNTHLHVVEAYANLYEVWPSENLKRDIIQLLKIFDEKILNQHHHHLGLFFDNDWKVDESLISYGHDIEAAWLLQSCAASIQDKVSIRTAKKNAILMTEAAMEGMDVDGGLWYEYFVKTGKKIFEKHWWPQAEALIGFCNAWQLTGDFIFKEALIRNWHFIRDHILDTQYGEWFWGIDRNEKKMTGQDKIGIWKCPYHNSRACLQLLHRLRE